MACDVSPVAMFFIYLKKNLDGIFQPDLLTVCRLPSLRIPFSPILKLILILVIIILILIIIFALIQILILFLIKIFMIFLVIHCLSECHFRI